MSLSFDDFKPRPKPRKKSSRKEKVYPQQFVGTPWEPIAQDIKVIYGIARRFAAQYGEQYYDPLVQELYVYAPTVYSNWVPAICPLGKFLSHSLGLRARTIIKELMVDENCQFPEEVQDSNTYSMEFEEGEFYGKLDCLTEVEKWLVMQKVVYGKSFEEVTSEYNQMRSFIERQSLSTISRWLKVALNKLKQEFVEEDLL